MALLIPEKAQPQESGFIPEVRIEIPSSWNPVGSGARALGMGGAFIAVADDATAASWNPAGLSYLRLPEVTLVGNHNSYLIERGIETDSFRGGSFDFAAFTWPVAFQDIHGSIQVSYQRAIGFDGTRNIDFGDGRRTDGESNGGFDVLAFGTGGAVAFGLNQLKPVFFTRHAVRKTVGLPVLGSVSMILSPDKIAANKRRAMGWVAANVALILLAGIAIVLENPISRLASELLGGGQL